MSRPATSLKSSASAAFSQPSAECRARRTARATVLDARVFGVTLVGGLDEQGMQVPGAHQRLLQVAEFDVEDHSLRDGRTQRRVGELHAPELQRQRGRVAPEQQFGEVVQQRGLVDQRRIRVHAMHREGEGEGGRPVRTAQHLADARPAPPAARPEPSSTVGGGPKARKNGEMPIITTAAVTVPVSVTMRGERFAAACDSTRSVISGSSATISPIRLASTSSSRARSASRASAVLASTGICAAWKCAIQAARSGSGWLSGASGGQSMVNGVRGDRPWMSAVVRRWD